MLVFNCKLYFKIIIRYGNNTVVAMKKNKIPHAQTYIQFTSKNRIKYKFM